MVACDVKITPYAKRFFACLECGEYEFSVEHIIDRVSETYCWSCNECGSAHSIRVLADGLLDVRRNHDRDITYGLAVAEMAATAPVFAVMRVIVERKDGYGDADFDSHEHVRYWLEEHTCPTNPIILEYVTGGDPDRHGLWRLVGLAPDLKQEDLLWRRILPGSGSNDQEEPSKHDEKRQQAEAGQGCLLFRDGSRGPRFGM